MDVLICTRMDFMMVKDYKYMNWQYKSLPQDTFTIILC